MNYENEVYSIQKNLNDDLCILVDDCIIAVIKTPIAYAEHIVDCANACRGIPQSILEQPDYSIKAELGSLAEQIQKRMKAEERVRELETYVEELRSIRAELFAKNSKTNIRVRELESVLMDIITCWDSPKWKESGTADIIEQARKTLASNKE